MRLRLFVKLGALKSRDLTTRDHIARVDIAKLDNAAPDQTVCRSIFLYFFLIFNQDFIIYIDFTHIAVSNTASDDVMR